METAEQRNESPEEVGAVSMSPSTSLLAKEFCGPMPPWVNVGKLLDWMQWRGIHIDHGPRHNRTDGEVDWILKAPDGATHRLNSNGYDYSLAGWQEAIDWIVANKQLHSQPESEAGGL